ncbi:MAG: sortase [Chloroflexi bacterium]|nr:sortase [Chloroflexota bacterium]NOH10325.1 sortase [Chloroflexota bacterium]
MSYFARLALLLAIFILLPLQQTLAAPQQTLQTVNGTVFLDLDADGTFDTNEPGVGGIDIDAFSTDNTPIVGGSATSAADGTYSIQTDDTQIARIEFTNIPSHLFSGPVGTDNQSSVVFLQSAAPSSTVNFGLMDPSRHCTANPNIVTPCYINGNPHGTGDAATGDVMVMFPYTASGAGGGANTYLADNSEIGATYGLAYQRTTGIMFASAVMKRHSGFGIISAVAGIPTTGGIYAIDPVAGTAVPFVDLNGLGGVNTGTDPHCYTDTGTLLGTDCLDSDSNNPTRDLNGVGGTDDAFDAVGKISFGDMDISADDRTLWLVNTNESDRALIEIFIDIDALGNPVPPTAADITEHAIPTTICTSGEERPWAVSVFQDRVFVGVVCDSTGDLTAPFPSLEAYVIAHTPGGGTGNFTQVDLNGAAAGNQIELDTSAYPRSYSSVEGGLTCTYRCITADWQPWADDWTDLYQPTNPDPVALNQGSTPFDHVDLVQPMLTDIEFLDNGYMILGLRDRAGDQTGNQNYSPIAADTTLYEGVTAGDLLCLSANDPTTPTVWTLEDDADCGTETSVGQTSTGTDQGPGGSEFFWQDMYDQNVPGVSSNPDNGIHHELTQGGLTYLPGTTEIVTTAFDPFQDVRTGGVIWFNTEDDTTTGGTNEAGTYLRGYEVFGQDAGGTPTTFGKSNGLGDLELICPAAPVEIGNRIWVDADNDGIQDGTVVAGAGTWAEPGINGVTVDLYLNDGATSGVYDGTNTFVATTVTAGAAPNQGQYYFTNLTVYTDYLVVIDTTQGALTGLNLTTPNAGAKDTIDSDATLQTVAATDYAVIFVDNRKGNSDPSDDTGGPGDNNHTYDAGFNAAVSFNLGDFVWIDDNFDGLQNEPAANGVNGVTVNLWLDGGDNTFDGGVGDDTLINTTVTADLGGNPATPGYYLFTNVAAGDYFVEFDDTTLPAGYGFTQQNVGGDDTIDSDVNPDSTATDFGVTLEFNFPATADDLTWDAGLVQLAELGNYVWEDDNTNGLQDEAASFGVNGVTVTLWLDDGDNIFNNALDTNLGSQLTADLSPGNPGYYLFTDLYPGNYFVEFSGIPPGFTGFTTQDVGGDDTIDSDPDTATGVTAIINLSPGESDLTWDAGLVGTGFGLGNYVWYDITGTLGDGLQNDGIPNGVNGVDVELWLDGGNGVFDGGVGGGADDVSQGTTVTADLSPGVPGYYFFPNLSAGNYFVQFTNPVNFTFTQQDIGGDAFDSDVNPNQAASDFGVTAIINFPATADDLTWDAGLIPAYDLGDYVWIDDNFNGQQDEPAANGVNGVDVILWQDGGDNTFDAGVGDDTQIATTTTADLSPGNPGYYIFTDLPAATYWVQFDSTTLPAGYGFTQQDQGADTSDSDVNPDSTATDFGVTTQIVFPATADDLTWDAGLVVLSSLGNYVWADDGDGLQNDGAASGQNGVTVNLYADDGAAPGVYDGTNTLLDTQLTADLSPGNPGYYLFTDLYPANYFVEVILPPGYTDFTTQDVGGDDTIDSDVEVLAGTNPGVTSVITLPHNTQDLTWDAGLIGNGFGLGDFVWFDTAFPTPADGIQNETPAEGVNGVTVELWLDGGNGVFDGGVGGGADDVSQGTTVTADLGGNPATPGYYFFPNLNAGNYFVQFSNIPAGFTFTQQNIGGDDSIDSDPDPTAGLTFGVTDIINFPATADDLTWDAGLVPLISSLGNYVWVDDTNNNIQDEAASFGLNGVTVELWLDGGDNTFDGGAGDDVSQGIQVTANLAANPADPGYYLFDNLAPGNYFVQFTEPAGFNFVLDNVGADDAIDSDANDVAGPTFGVTPLITLPANTQDLRWDAGLIATAPASLGDFVWDDLNADGIQDVGEPGINGVLTELYTGCGAGTPACTTFVTSMLTTNNPVGGAPGWYRFDNLTPGVQYQVQWTLPIGTIFSPQWVNGPPPPDDPVDSDADQAVGPNLGRSHVVSMAPGEHNPTIDAGLDPNKVGDFVWIDVNKDGIQDPGEPAVPNIPVRLIRDTNGNLIYDPGVDTLVASQTTDSAGRYLFTPNDPAANFFVVFDPPPGVPITAINTGPVDLDSDVDPLCNCTVVLNVPAGVTDLTWDMGLLFDLDEDGNLILPETGFAPDVVTELPAQPEEKEYADLGDLWLEIPSLDIEMPIVGVPFGLGEGWDVTWLDDAAGYLEGTSYPTQVGNTAITAHVTDAFGNEGPFAHLEELGFGDVFYIHAFGRKYTYEVVNNQVVSPTYTAVLDDDAFDRVTLLTCKGYQEDTDTYQYRVAVEAVLVSFGPDVPDE